MELMGLGSEEIVSLFIPTFVYWAYALIYHMAGPWLQKYRLHTKEEEGRKNMITRGEVIRGVLLEQLSQVVFIFTVFMFQKRDGGADELAASQAQRPTLLKTMFQILVAMMTMDTWQYFAHRFLHINFLYKHLHSKHHRLVVTHVFGALYTHPLESIIVDTVGIILALVTAGMDPRIATIFLCFVAIKIVDDHCGYWIWWNPFQRLFSCNSASHGVHHELYGNKYNYAAPFFMSWDKLLGTYMHYEIVKRENGDGLECKVAKRKLVRHQEALSTAATNTNSNGNDKKNA